MFSMMFLFSLALQVVLGATCMTTDEWMLSVNNHYQRFVREFNNTDLFGWLQYDTSDVHLLPPGEPVIVGKPGVVQRYGLKILKGTIDRSIDLQVTDLRWHCGDVAVSEYIAYNVHSKGTKDVENGMTLHRMVDGSPKIMSSAWTINEC